MPTVITILVLVAGVIICIAYASAQAKKERAEIAERRRWYVESLSPTVRIIVNDGIHLFFKDDEQQFFGLDETGKKYSFDGLHSIHSYSDGIFFMHKDSCSLCVGKDYSQPDTTVALDSVSISKIYAEMMPVLRKNLRKELDKYGVNPTHEYEVDGSLFGCDINSRQFYMVYGSPTVYDFADLKKVTIEDVSNNSLCSFNYSIHVYIRHEDSFWDQYPECDIDFDSKDSTFNGILAMFKGIRNRQ